MRTMGDALAAIELSRERWYEAEVNRITGEIALKSPGPNGANAETYFDRALAVARRQQAKSWELRVAMSMARRWRDQWGRRIGRTERHDRVHGHTLFASKSNLVALSSRTSFSFQPSAASISE
jgi:predicted ATPase